MPMTKGEKTRMDNLYDRLALRWPSDKTPVPMTVEEIKAARTVEGSFAHYRGCSRVARGWFANSHSMTVTLGSSDGSLHCREGTALSTKDHGQMFRTKSEAWAWIKHEKAREFSKVMGKIEREIEAALAESETE